MRVLLVHGMAGSAASTWRDNGWIDVLRDEGHHVEACDLLGHGDAPRPHDPAAFSHLADPLDAALDAAAHAGEPIALVGFSLGARLSLEVALRRPTDVAALVLLGVGAGLFESWDHEPLAAALAASPARPAGPASPAVPAATHPFVTHLIDLARTYSDPLCLAALLRYRGNDAIDPVMLGALSQPALVVVGDADPVGPAGPLADALGSGRALTVARCDHFALPRRFEAIDATVQALSSAHRRS